MRRIDWGWRASATSDNGWVPPLGVVPLRYFLWSMIAALLCGSVALEVLCSVAGADLSLPLSKLFPLALWAPCALVAARRKQLATVLATCLGTGWGAVLFLTLVLSLDRARVVILSPIFLLAAPISLAATVLPVWCLARLFARHKRVPRAGRAGGGVPGS
jgi:hypothetical protein